MREGIGKLFSVSVYRREEFKKLLPIAEIFWSIQGEGVHVGTPMLFVRLAGCTVGKYLGQRTPSGAMHILPADVPLMRASTHSICTTADGQRFLCDTDYHAHLGAQSLVGAVSVNQTPRFSHVCITGGEPLMHSSLSSEIEDLLKEFPELTIHIETSGTIPIPAGLASTCWITCSPKEGLLEENAVWVDEWKILCGPSFDEEVLSNLLHTDLHTSKIPVFIQPIQGVNEPDQEGFAHCMEILKRHPNWRLSGQLHKFLHLR